MFGFSQFSLVFFCMYSFKQFHGISSNKKLAWNWRRCRYNNHKMFPETCGFYAIPVLLLLELMLIIISRYIDRTIFWKIYCNMFCFCTVPFEDTVYRYSSIPYSNQFYFYIPLPCFFPGDLHTKTPVVLAVFLRIQHRFGSDDFPDFNWLLIFRGIGNSPPGKSEHPKKAGETETRKTIKPSAAWGEHIFLGWFRGSSGFIFRGWTGELIGFCPGPWVVIPLIFPKVPQSSQTESFRVTPVETPSPWFHPRGPLRNPITEQVFLVSQSSIAGSDDGLLQQQVDEVGRWMVRFKFP